VNVDGGSYAPFRLVSHWVPSSRHLKSASANKSFKKGDEGFPFHGETAAGNSFLDLSNTSDRLESVSEMSC